MNLFVLLSLATEYRIGFLLLYIYRNLRKFLFHIGLYLLAIRVGRLGLWEAIQCNRSITYDIVDLFLFCTIITSFFILFVLFALRSLFVIVK